MSKIMSNLWVSVEFQNKAVFAGENLECVITFKNTAQVSSSKFNTSQAHNHDSPRERWKDEAVTNSLHSYVEHSHIRSQTTAFAKVHRHSAPLRQVQSTTSTASKGECKANVRLARNPGDRSHGRSISIVSIGGDTTSTDHKSPLISASKRPGQGHSRAASLQFLPMRYITPTKTPTSSQGIHTAGAPISTKEHGQSFNHGHASKVSTIPSSNTSSLHGEARAVRGSGTSVISSKVNQVLSSPHNRATSDGFSSSPRNHRISSSPRKAPRQARDTLCKDRSDSTALKLDDRLTQSMDSPNSLAGAFSSKSNEGTPRSSIEKYSISNNSSDTLASEYVIPQISPGMHRSIPQTQHFRALSSRSHRIPETLLMGYGNITGVFTLDPSLVNTSLFDKVKEKAVIGNQGGGGVIRSEVAKRRSGLLGSFGLNALGESLGGLLGGSEVSSIKEKAIDGKWIPLISTPQALLFIDLCLEPGQSQSYSYSHQLPAGLPPTYKGKVVRFAYNVVIGVQRATESAQRHVVHHFEFPFRVLPGVNGKAYAPMGWTALTICR